MMCDGIADELRGIGLGDERWNTRSRRAAADRPARRVPPPRAGGPQHAGTSSGSGAEGVSQSACRRRSIETADDGAARTASDATAGRSFGRAGSPRAAGGRPAATRGRICRPTWAKRPGCRQPPRTRNAPVDSCSSKQNLQRDASQNHSAIAQYIRVTNAPAISIKPPSFRSRITRIAICSGLPWIGGSCTAISWELAG